MSVDKVVRSAGRAARENDKYTGCAQAVLGALQRQFAIGDTESFRSATVLSGGVARRRETCGALPGALKGIGLVYGREDMQDTAAYGRAVTEARLADTMPTSTTSCVLSPQTWPPGRYQR
ncbi:MAG: C_GCAxxG_C_C family protein [Chloroflexi bacterium]|nr:C_GCAxxG_C_C family protein [Chloroflexota bacterium]